MIHGDATAAALEAVLEELGAAEDRAARAGHALAELEELAEETPAAAAGLDACRRRLRRPRSGWPRCGRRRDLEVRLGERRGAAGARGPFRDDGLSAPVASASRPAG